MGSGVEVLGPQVEALDPSRASHAEARLAGRYGSPGKLRLDPLEELVLTILSQSTTDRNRDRAWDALRDRYPAWNAVRRAPRAELETTIRIAGLATQKAAAIHTALERLQSEVGSPSLDHLTEMSDDDALAYLSSFKGVGIKTAACVLCFALGRSVLPVDTHVYRIAIRLGWVPPGATPAATHRVLNQHVPEGIRFALHIHLIELGRDLCTARRPSCERCPLADTCPRVGVRIE